MAATKTPSGSTCAGFEKGAGTADGEADAGTVTPPSNVQLYSREYLPLRKSELVRCHLIAALNSEMVFSWDYFITCGSCQVWPSWASRSSAAIGPQVPAA